MVLNYKTKYLGDNSIVALFEAPRVMRRVFFGIYMVAWTDTAFSVHISFGDPRFVNFVSLTHLKTYYEFECAYIPQGVVFVQKIGATQGSISAIEILK